MDKLKILIWTNWNKLKNGRNEIGVVWGTVSFILLIAIKLDIDLSLAAIVLLGSFFLVVSYLVGLYVTEYVIPETNRINPFSQDNINSSLYLQQSLIYFYQYFQTNDKACLEKAILEMDKAHDLRTKWLK